MAMCMCVGDSRRCPCLLVDRYHPWRRSCVLGDPMVMLMYEGDRPHGDGLRLTMTIEYIFVIKPRVMPLFGGQPHGDDHV